MTRCFHCRNAEREDDLHHLVGRYEVRDPDTGQMTRGYICEDHVSMLLDDGYTVREIGKNA